MNSNLTDVEESVAGLNGNLKGMIVESIVFQANNENYRYINKPGYYLAAAVNGDWNSRQFYIIGIAHQDGDNLVFFDKAITGSTRVNCIWVKPTWEL